MIKLIWLNLVKFDERKNLKKKKYNTNYFLKNIGSNSSNKH